MSVQSKKSRNKRNPAQNAAYKAEGRREKNKFKKLDRHLKSHPKDVQSTGAIK